MRISDWSSDVCSSDLLFDRVGAAKTVVELAPVDQVLGLDLHIGAALARLGVLNLGDLPDAAFIFDNIAGTDFNAGDFHRASFLRRWHSSRMERAKRRPTGHSHQIGRAPCRERGGQYVEISGGAVAKKKK